MLGLILSGAASASTVGELARHVLVSSDAPHGVESLESLGGACGGGPSILPPDMPGWPYHFDTWRPRADGLIVQADDDRELEILWVSPNASKLIHLMNHDGTHVKGFPLAVGEGADARPASFGDLDGDGLGEIVVACDHSPNGGAAFLHAYHTDGSVVAGFPYVTGGDSGSNTVVDLDGDGRAEIIIHEHRPGPDGYIHLVGGDGRSLPGWPFRLDSDPATSAAAADLDGDGVKEVIYASYRSLFALHMDGTQVEGFPYTLTDGGYFWLSDPVVADADGDGRYEIAIGSSHRSPTYGRLHVIGPTGELLDGWPQQVARRINIPPTFADLDGDGDLEIIAAEAPASICPAGYVHAWHSDGTLVDGFPYGPVHGVKAQIAVGDVDGDGLPELLWDDDLTTDGIGWLNGCRADGTSLIAWPLTFEGTPVFNTPALADVDIDGDVEILCCVGTPGAEGGTIFLWDTAGNPKTIQMPMIQYSPGRDGLYRGPTTTPVVGHAPPVVSPGLRAYPNPANPRAVIEIELEDSDRATLVVYDLAGRAVRTLMTGEVSGPRKHIVWDSRDDAGLPVASGSYRLRLVSSRGRVDEPLVLIR